MRLFLYNALLTEEEGNRLRPKDAKGRSGYIFGCVSDMGIGRPALKIHGEKGSIGTADYAEDRKLLNAEILVNANEHDKVFGELIEFSNDDDLAPIDAYLGFTPGTPSPFRRILVPVMITDEVINAYTYEYCGDAQK